MSKNRMIGSDAVDGVLVRRTMGSAHPGAISLPT